MFGFSALREIDWKTPATGMRLECHWRIILSMVACTMAYWGVLSLAYEHSFAFTRMWAAAVMGGTTGVAIGGTWQLMSRERRPQTNGQCLALCLVAWGGMSIFAIQDLYQFRAEEFHLVRLRAVQPDEITRIDLEDDKPESRITIRDKQAMIAFAELLPHAEPFFPSHEISIRSFHIAVFLRNGTVLDYDARIPERHPTDVSIDFFGAINHAEIRIPGARAWFDKMTTETPS